MPIEIDEELYEYDENFRELGVPITPELSEKFRAEFNKQFKYRDKETGELKPVNWSKKRWDDAMEEFKNKLKEKAEKEFGEENS